MSNISTKRNGQFPSRKNGETNVLSPVVSQSKISKRASKKSLRMSNYFFRISIVFFMLVFFYCAFLLIGMDFNVVLMKLQSMLLGKSLHFLFSRLGWCGGGLIFLAIICFDPETMGKMMAHSGASSSASGERGGWADSSWIDRWLDREKASLNPRELEDEAGTSAPHPNPTPDSIAGENPPEGQPAPNAAAEQPYDAGVGPQEEGQPVEAFPYADDQVIGGDSVNGILRRLLGRHPPFPPSEIIEFCRVDARDLMEAKVEIIQKMAPWDQGGDWVGSGARALDNPRTATGEESLENLYKILEDLNEAGPMSDSFSKLQGKVRRLL